MMTMVCLFLEGGNLFGQGDIDIINSLVGYNVIDAEGIGIATMATGFFLHGLPKLILWDYSFFTGGWVIIRIVLICTLSLGILWGVIATFLTLASSIVTKILNR